MSENASALSSSTIALISLASGIAAKHPDMGLCQLEKLRHMGITESDIDTVIEIARHIRDEASQKLDAVFDEKAGSVISSITAIKSLSNENNNESCCSSTSSGQSCC